MTSIYEAILAAIIPLIISLFSYIFIRLFASCRYICTALHIIHTELKPNHGTSLRDAIDRIEKTVIFNEKRNRILLNLCDYAIFETNSKGECIWVNDKYIELTCFENLEELLGNNWVNSIHEDDRKFVESSWNEALSHQRIFDLSYRFCCGEYDCKDKEIKVYCKAYPIIKNTGLVGYIGVIYEIDKLR